MKKLLIIMLPFLFIIGCGNDASKNTEDVAASNELLSKVEKTESDSNVDKHNNDENTSGSTEATEEAVKKEDSSNDKEVNNKETYLTKLDEIEENLADLKEKVENGNQTEMNIAQDEIYQKWDEALNEVYRVLESQLSKEEMDILRVEQRKWVEERDVAAEKASEEYKGGTLEPFVYSKSLAEWTKERSYFLVNNYMN